MALTLKKQADKAKQHDDDADEKPSESPRKIKPRKFSRGSRFVLFVGDEGAILLYIKNNNVISRQFVPDASEQNLEELRVSLNLDPKAPILLAIDSMDQNYIQQTLPPVSSMSVKKLIDRRLQRDFAPTDIKGAIFIGREKTGRKDWNFLMVAIERTRHTSMWLDFALALPNRFQGIYLVSVETETVIKDIEQAMGIPKEGTGSEWKFFVSHNKVGGFRQVILRNGRIIFTRMSQPIGESTPEVIAGSIEQEMQSTIEYMKRLTFNLQVGLDVYIIASSAVKPFIDKNKFFTNTFNVMTPYEVAGYLGIEGATQPTDQFGDVILAAAIATSKKHVLTLTTPESRKFDKLYTVFRFQRVICALIILGLLGYAGDIACDIYLKITDGEDLQHTKSTHQKRLNDLRDEIKASSLDIDKIGDLMEQYDALLKQFSSPFTFINKMQTVIKPPIRIKNIDWQMEDKTAAGSAIGPHKITVVMTLQFPGITTPEAFKAYAKTFMEELKTTMGKEYEVTFGKLPSQYAETENINVNFDSNAPVAPNNVIPDVTLTFKEL